jgi:hypothetical protein
MTFRFNIYFCILVFFFLAFAKGSIYINETAMEQQDERKLLFGRSRKVGESCGIFTRCGDGLECTRVSLTRKICLPRECVVDAFVDEFVSDSNLISYRDEILGNTGLLGDKNLFNETTLALVESLGRDGLTEENARYILNGNARESIIAAMLDNPLNITAFNQRGQECAARAAFAGVTGYGGIVLEAELGASFYNAYYFAQGTNDTSGGLYTDICLGIGASAAVLVGGLGGLAITNTRRDLNGIAVFFDGDIAAAIGIGLSAGLVFPSFAPRLEMTLSTGVGAGIGGSICFTTDLTEFP